VCLYVWDAAHLFYEKKSQAASHFAKETLLRLLRGEVEGVIRSLRWKGTHKKLSKRRLEELERICGYFENNRHRMAYNEYLQAGYPIALGVCWFTVNRTNALSQQASGNPHISEFAFRSRVVKEFPSYLGTPP
jgi:hypothetical protein